VKAQILYQFGEPEVMRWEEVDTPTPGRSEVVVAVRAVSVNRTLDLQVRQDGGGYGAILPLVLGNDCAGVVAQVGEGVSQPRVGDPVAISQGIHCGHCDACRGGNRQRCRRRRMLGIHLWGGYAEYVKVPASNCVTVPAGVSFYQATIIARHFPLAFAEARKARLQAGDWALVMGASGGLGSCIVQVAKTLGARVIAGAGAEDRVRAGLDLGADYGVNYRQQDLAQEVRRITEGRGVDVVFENIGDPDTWPRAFASLASGGRLVTAGAHGGGMVNLDVKLLYQRRLQVLSGLGDDRMEDLARSLQLAGEGSIEVLIDRVMPLSQAVEAHHLVARNETLGKVVLDPTLG
jgi:NADPH:quinone reductase-like Zn-dependent oxidoreductase